jgi:type VI secretion system protein ImpH
MAGAQRTADDPVAATDPTSSPLHAQVLASATRWDFFVTVGMLERLTPDAVRIGGDGPAQGEAIRFHHDPSLAFSAGDVSAASYELVPRGPAAALERKQYRYHVTTTFLGLTGSSSPLPLFMSEEIAQLQDAAQLRREFLDIFHHRLVSFVFRIGVKYDIAREFSLDCSDAWTRRVLALAGFDAWSGRKTKHIPVWRLARLAPLLASRVRSARAIEVALRDVCGEALGDATIEILQFAGGWSPLDPSQRTLLAVSNSVLGRSAVLGVQCFHRAGKAVIRIGPLRENFRRFLVDGDMYPVVRELLELMSPEPIDFELDLELDARARPPFVLGRESGQRIGVDTWLSSRSGPANATHVKVVIEPSGGHAPALPDDTDLEPFAPAF